MDHLTHLTGAHIAQLLLLHGVDISAADVEFHRVDGEELTIIAVSAAALLHAHLYN